MQRTDGSLSETTGSRTLTRGLAVLETLTHGDDAGLGLSNIAQRVGLDKATVTRLARTLVAAGYVVQDAETRRYRLTGKILWLAHSVAAHRDLRGVARPHITALRDELGETVHLGIMDDLQVVYVDKLEAPHSIQLVSAVGQSMPLHTTALGKAMLAALPEIDLEAKLGRMDLAARTERTICDVERFREEVRLTQVRGYAIDDRENEPLGACVAAAIRSASGLPVGAISVSGPHFRIRGRLPYFGGRVRAAAEAIAHEMGPGDDLEAGPVGERRPGTPTGTVDAPGDASAPARPDGSVAAIRRPGRARKGS